MQRETSHFETLENISAKPAKTQRGYVLMPRVLLNTQIWQKPAYYLKLFLYILCRVNYSDTGYIKRGEGVFDFRVEKFEGITEAEVCSFLEWAERKEVNLLTTKPFLNGLIIKVVNYNHFQTPKNYNTYAQEESFFKRGARAAVEAETDYYMSISNKEYD